MFETEDLKAAHLKPEDSESQDTHVVYPRGRLGVGCNRRADSQKRAKI